ncbi:MAG: Hsp20/alpha crystallin family protein [Saprospiraceae bacterium]|nr:Hsp20/alpha crystallin family protein [Saprospiraceae bacterium]
MCYHNQSFHGNQGMKSGYGHRGEYFRKMASAMHNGGWGRGFFKVPVNVAETETAYELSVFAPGRDKTLFSLTVKDKVLSIAYKAPEADEAQQSNWRNQEYAPVSFERQFLLNNKVDETGIVAQYTEGVLKVVLPKTAEAQRPAQDIKVS